MPVPYIVKKLSNNNVNEITIPSDYKVIAQSDSPSLALDGSQFIAQGDPDLLFPKVDIISIGDPPGDSIYVVEDTAKVLSYDNLIDEIADLKSDILAFDFDGESDVNLLLALRKLGKIRQIEMNLDAGNF